MMDGVAGTGRTERKLLLGTILLLVSLIVLAKTEPSPPASARTAPAHANSTLTHTTYLPHVASSGTFHHNQPIWPQADVRAPHQVALFRRDFTLDEVLSDAELLIFADTRYELWVDGTRIGRGPARFSTTTREYDLFQLGDLPPGGHLIAVLVQWAPNTRRSESSTPLLLAHLQGTTSQGRRVFARTGPRWKALLSDAWRQDAAPVHEWGLIGPSELVDLRELPPNWMAPSFPDADWPDAEVRASLHAAGYHPRSIPMLDQVPITATVISTGSLSPGYQICELAPWISAPHTVSLASSATTEFVMEALTGTEASLATFASLDGDDLDWEKVGAHRPDVYAASATIEAGTHALRFGEIPPDGLTFALSKQGISLDALPFEQSVHAGRRLLLAQPSRSPGAVSVSSGEELAMTFERTPAYAVLDLGRVVHGRLTAEVSGAPGTVVDIGWDERVLTGTTRPLPYPGSLHPQWNQTDSWILDGAPRSMSTMDTRAGRYVIIAAWNGGSVELRDIQVHEERYPVVQRGEFHASNALLDAIWQVGVDTLYPNMTDGYTDTPWRERGQWWGDAYVGDHVNRVAFGDTALVARGLLLMADEFVGGRPPARAPHGGGELLLDYGMLWVQTLYDHYLLTEERQLPDELYAVLSDFMTYLARLENVDTGLLDVPCGQWWETTLIDWKASHSRCGQSAAINALYYGTLMDASRLARAVREPTDADAWHQKAQRVRDQVNAHLYLPAQQRYATTLFEGETITPSVHAQAWPLAYGLVPDGEVADVASSLLELLPRDPHADASSGVGIYGMFWVLEALGRAGRISEALDLIEMRYGRLLELGATTWWEGFNAHLSYTASLSHGWGGAPTWFLTRYLLGARRTGATAWQVKPPFSGVRHVSGTLPLEDGGHLRVQWERSTCAESRLELRAPDATRGEVVIPSVHASTLLTLNGQPIWRGSEPLADGLVQLADGVHVPLQGGAYTLQVVRDCTDVFMPTVAVGH